MTETLTAFDIIVLAVLALSTIAAFGRGFTTVALSFAAWFGAFVGTAAGLELIKPYAREIVSPPELADLLALAVVFFALLFILKMLAEFIGGMIKSGPIGFLDRSLGALFGLLRGIIILSVAWLAFSRFYPSDEMPDWVAESRLRPLVAWGADMVGDLAQDLLGSDDPQKLIDDKLKDGTSRYLKENRDKLDDMIEKVMSDEDTKNKDGKKEDDGGIR